MPRVSDQHLAARRRQILDAARRCFLRDGFHATSMQHVIAEADLSVGAIYRYFGSKTEIVAAIAEEVVGGVEEVLGAMVRQEPPLPLAEMLRRALSFVDSQTGEQGAFRLAVVVWAEALRDPVLADFVSGAYSRIRQNFVEMARQAQRQGVLPADTDAEAMGAVLFGMLPAYALQKILTGGPAQEAYLAGIVALLPPQARAAT